MRHKDKAQAEESDPLVDYAITLANCWDKGIPPVAGGAADQPNWALEAIAVIAAWTRDHLAKRNKRNGG